ncbi:signal peptidase I [Kocuria sp.]|uniref:signal peptidase I n=1 Tax=Kocuria sp. TaxID=1871328 RepID=UPI0026DC9645|nr:signal peptidase I [Kocuria sp.]MDO4918491.1 signal peptidase I [Kocuria sp.]
MAEQHGAGAPGAPGTDGTSGGRSSAGQDTREPGRARRGRGRRTSRSSGGWGAIREIAVVVVLALLIAFVAKTFLVRGYYIPSGSMEQTLELDDRIFVNVLGARTGHIDRGDIVVFDDTQGWLPEAPATRANPVRQGLEFVGLLPDSSQQALVKRVIGVGGDHVACCSPAGKVTVNGKELDEPYLYPGAAPSDFPFDVTVPEGKFFVMGDHRNASADSRYHIGTGTEFVSEDDVVGTAFVTAWPLSRFHWIHNPEDVFRSVPAPSGS